MNIYVGNLPFRTNNSELEEMFTEFGAVDSAAVIMDATQARSRGFGFVEMPNQDEGQKAIERNVDGADMGGRTRSRSTRRDPAAEVDPSGASPVRSRCSHETRIGTCHAAFQ